MRLTTLVCGVWFLLLPGFAHAQEQSKDANEIREQIEALQQHLTDLQRGEQEKRRMAEIDGGSFKSRGDREALILRAYDLNDLFAPVPQYPARKPAELDGVDAEIFPPVASEYNGFQGGMGGGMGGMGGGGGFFQVGVESSTSGGAGSSIHDLVNVIYNSTTGPWMDVHGEGTEIVVLGTTLIVRTTLETHLQIERLLEVLRKVWGKLRIVRLEVDWLWMTESEVQELVRSAEGSVVRTVTDDDLRSIRDSQGDERPQGRSAQITCYNGQTVSLQSVRQIPAVTSVTPVLSQSGAAFQPALKAVSDGAVVQIHPLVSRSGKYVVLNLHSRVNEVDDSAVQTYDATMPKLDRPQLLTHRLSTSLRAPQGIASLAGGMTHSTLDLESEGSFGLYLFVRASVEDIQDVVAEEADGSHADEDPKAHSDETTGAPQVDQ